MPPIPTVADVRAWTNVSMLEVTDDQLQLIIDAESDLQAAYCTWDFDVWQDGEVPEPLAQALLRRCARALAARGVPLGSLPATSAGLGAEYGLPGAGLLPRYDAEIERYEAPFRLAGIA